MGNQFIKLKSFGEEKYVYISPEDIRCLEWDAKTNFTTVGISYGGNGVILRAFGVEQTPGEIFEACRKALAKQNK